MSRGVAFLGEAATLPGSREPRSNERLEGFATRPKRDRDMPFDRVTIDAPVDGEFRFVGTDPAPEPYDEIAKAYDGRRVVPVEGDPERREQRRVPVDPEEIDIVPLAADGDRRRCVKALSSAGSPRPRTPIDGLLS